MTAATLEHANITVVDAPMTAEWLCRVFGWHVRWEGKVMGPGYSIHVGNDSSYLALYTPDNLANNRDDGGYRPGKMNHVGVVVEDLDATETRVNAEGFSPHHHADYEPGKRFYFFDDNGIEYEVISYA